MVLMILCNIWGWNQDGCSSCCFQLRKGGSSCTADYQICCSKAVIHIVDVLTDIDIGILFKVCSLFPQHLRKILYTIFSGCVDMMNLSFKLASLFGVPCHQVCHRLIQAVCSLTSAKRNDTDFIPDRKFFSCLLAICIDNRLPHRIADYNFFAFRVKIFFCFRHSQKDLIDISGQKLCGDTRKSVRLMGNGLDSQLSCLP